MTKKEALELFRAFYPPGSFKRKNGKPDRIARREAWSNWTDALERGGEITRRQCDTWSNPF